MRTIPIDAQILFALRHAGGGAVSGADLSHKLGISRAAIWARIEELRSLGYEIEASPHRGYRLLHVPDLLHADDLLSLVQGNRVIGRDIQVYQETGSTNEVVDRLARAGVKEGIAVFAEAQSKGRGRLGRKWFSPAGKGLWFSILLRPDLRPQAATQLTVAAATSLARAVRQQTGLQPEIKWPNDLLLSGKKVAGILTELSAELDCIQYVVLGIGLDVNISQSELPADLRKLATSLKIETGRAFRRADLAAAIFRELDQDYALIAHRQFPKLAEEWEGYCTTLGHGVRIKVGERILAGRAESLDEDGALLLRTQHGHLERVIGGDVTLEK
jgi:BirA family transcriptional regulator, biotin operon repressor / biotin---[acetyl-CoA-carboxylase] ligase